jgi:hypothetical protein
MQRKIKLFTPCKPENYLEAAIEAARWIRGFEERDSRREIRWRNRSAAMTEICIREPPG